MEEINISFSREQADMIKYVKRPTKTAIKPEVVGISKKIVRFPIGGVYWKKFLQISAVNKLT